MDDDKIANHVADQFYNASNAVQEAGWEARNYWEDMRRPSMMLRPELLKDNGKWNALYHDVAGVGLSPEEAYLDFDRKWKEKICQ